MALIHPLAKTERERKALAYWAANPVEAVKDWFGVTPEPYQGDTINSLLAPRPGKQHRCAVKSGHGVGKTAMQSWIGWTFLITRLASKVVATAPTSHQLMDILWPEFSKWYARMPENMRGMWDISATHIRCKEKRFEKTWFATARTSNKPENMQGFHEDHILVLCEEASGIPQNIFEVIEGILTNAEDDGQEALLLLSGNPTQTGGEFYDAYGKNQKLYHRITVSGDRDAEKMATPRDGKFYVSPRVSAKFCENMERKYGKQSPVYDVRVRGLFPKEADDVVIPLSWAENAQMVELPHFDSVADGITMVMDVARFGGDETVLGIFRKGHCISMHSWPKTSTNQCVDILVEAYKYGAFGVGSVPVVRTIVDEPGVGGGVVDSARRSGVPITPYNGGASLRKDVDADDDIRMFANRRSRDWWHVRRLMEQKRVHIPLDETLVNQLASVKYDYVNEKIKVETKKEMRERLGDDASPDRADVIIMGMAPLIGVRSTRPLEQLLQDDFAVLHGEDRPTAMMDF